MQRNEIKSFDELRARLRQLVEQTEGPLPPEESDTVQKFLAEVDLPKN